MNNEEATPADERKNSQPAPSPTPPTTQDLEPTPGLVLIAEDEEPIAETLAWIVEGLGYTPLIAHNGRDALRLARTHHPALLITDWMMPLMDGVGLIRALRAQVAQDGLSPIPIIMLSAGRKQPPPQVQVDGFLPKPFELAELEALLLRFLSPQAPDA